MSLHRIALQLMDRTPRGLHARAHLLSVLEGVASTEPDEGGCFEVCLDCGSQEDALRRVWNAVAATGCDDHLVILEHADIPRHWEHRPSGGEIAAG